MKTGVVSRLVIPGLEGENEICLDHPKVTLRLLLDELSSKSFGRIKYIEPSNGTVDPMNFVIEVNGVEIQDSRESLEAVLKDGDTVSINLTPLGGG